MKFKYKIDYGKEVLYIKTSWKEKELMKLLNKNAKIISKEVLENGNK